MTRKFLAPVSAGPDGQIAVNYARYFRDAVAIAFESTGGQPRFNDWAQNNYGDYAKTFLTRMIPKEVEVQASESIDDLLLKLNARVIDVTPRKEDDA